MKMNKSVKGGVLTVKITLPIIRRDDPPMKFSTSNVLNSPELSGYEIVTALTTSTIESSEKEEVTGEWTFRLKPKESKQKRVPKKVVKKME